MPYILQTERLNYDEEIGNILAQLKVNNNNPGHINYIFSKIVTEIFKNNKKYSTANDLIGVLECVKIELYRQQIADYEDFKEKMNGSI